MAFPGSLTYVYDLVGNRVTDREGDKEVQYETNALDQYTSRDGSDFRYDGNGNVTSDAHRLFVYDAVNRLVRVQERKTRESVVAYVHDSVGRRLVEQENGVSTHVVWDNENEIAEYRDGSLFAMYVHEDGIDRPIQIAAEGSEHWVHGDSVGSVRLLSDKHGSVAARYEYSAFGSGSVVPKGSPYNPFRYTSRRFSAALASYNFRAREYSPLTGRFLQRDSLGIADDTNLYSYARNCPLVFVDPAGTDARPEAAKASRTRGRSLGYAAFPMWLNRVWRRIVLESQGGAETEPYIVVSDPLRVAEKTDVSELAFSGRDFEQVLRWGLPDESDLTEFEEALISGRIAQEWSSLGSPEGRFSTLQIALDVDRGTVGYKAHFSHRGSTLFSRYGEFVAGDLPREAAASEVQPADFASLGVSSFVGRRLLRHGLRRIVPGSGGIDDALGSLSDAEVESALGSMSSRHIYGIPISATEAGYPVETMIPVARWGRRGLKAGDWIVKGSPTKSNYALSFKWDPNPTNIRAPYSVGEGYFVPPEWVSWPKGWGLEGWWKGLFKQRRYSP
jgi:RHS repeat-associated protein